MSAATTHSLLRDTLDSRALLAYLGAMLTAAFLLQHPLQLVALCSATWLVVVGVLDAEEYRPYLMFGAFTAATVMILNPLVSRAGATIVWAGPTLPLVGQIVISAEALIFGFAMALRLFAVVGLFALYSALVDSDAVYRLVAPYSLGSALVISLSVRLFGTNLRDGARIKDAMRSRGVVFEGGGLQTSVRSHAWVVESLTMTSLDRAMNLAEALEARGFGRPGRTRVPAPSFSAKDRLMVMVAVATVAVGVVWGVVAGGFTYYPRLGLVNAGFDLLGAVVIGVLAVSPLLGEWGYAAWLSSKSSS